MEAAHSFSLLDSSRGEKKQLLNKCPLRTAEGSIRINGKALRGRQGLANILGMHENLKVLFETSSYHSQRPRHIDCLLVLFPVVALVISFTIIAHLHRNDRKAKHQEIKECHASHSGSRTIRWRSILSDHSIDGTVNPSSGEGPNDFLKEDHPLTEFEEFCNEYSKLKPAYLKFLSDCGMSKWGYWRGGSQE